jgi:single-strand DNA-binding protein
MSGCLNSAEVIGNLGQNPEVRATQKGGRVVTFSVATNESWKNEAGEKQERTDWHRVVVFSEKLGELVEKYLKKGSKVFVKGALRSRKWTDKEGVEHYGSEIQITQYEGSVLFLDRKSDESTTGESAPDTREAA